jgi:hypothetical protein
VARTSECGEFIWVSHEWKQAEEGEGGVLRIRFKLAKQA